MAEQDEALREKESSFLEELGRQVSVTANVRCIFGEPIDRDGVTVIPVAQAGYGFGGGSGKKELREGKGEGAGGGGGGMVIPIGYIEIKNGETRFRPTRDSLAIVPAILAAAPVAFLMIWKVAKLLKGKQLK
jgi:uncharacterized spore protein YtfJ